MKTKLLLVFAFLAFQNSFANPIAPTLQPIQYCDPNNDGFGIFDLESVTPIIVAAQSGSASDFVVTYHEVPDDAQIGAFPIGNPYNNINPWSQIIYYRVRQISNNTYATGEVKLNITPVPDINSAPDLSMCDYNNNGIETFNLLPLVQQVLGAMNPAQFTVTFHTTLTSAQVGLNPITPINAYSGTNGQIIYVRVTRNNTGCYAVSSFQLHVEPLPSSMQPSYPDYALCDINVPIGYETFDLGSQINAIAMGQIGVDVTFYPSLGNAQNATNPIINLQYTNTVQFVQTLGIRLTNQATGCYIISTMDIRVNPLPNLIPPISPYTICDANQDGFAAFDLTSLVPGLIQGSAINVTFHETQMEAEIGANPLSSPYYNINPFIQVLYVRGSDPISGCYSVMQIELYVNPSPIAASVNSIEVCDMDVNSQSGTTLIDLTVQTAEILSQQPLPPSGYVVTYYNSQANAEAATSLIIPANNYFGADGEMIWFRIESTATHCYAVGSFHIIINTPLPLTTPTPLQVCDSDANPNDQHTVFDLTIKDPELTQGSPSAFVTYYPSLLHAQNGTNAISNPTAYVNTIPAVQTLGVSVTSSTGCISITTLDIRVIPVPTPNLNPPALVPQCDVNNTGDMLEVFDLTVNEAYIRNGNPNLTLHYYTTMADAIDSVNEILTPTVAVVGGNVWIRVENNYVDFMGNHCYVLVEQPLTVYVVPNPIIYTASNGSTICVDYVTHNVMQSLTLDSGIANPSAYTFEWYEMGSPSVVIGTASTFTVNTPSSNGATRSYVVKVDTNGSLGCYMISSSFDVIQSGPAVVTSIPGYTITNLSGIQSITVAISGYGIYEYSLDNGPHQTSNVFNNAPLGTHQIHVWDVEGGCGELLISNIVITESQIPAPIGLGSQTFPPGATLADVIVNGSNIQWYATANNKNNLTMLSTPLPLSTVLVDGTTYYATQTVGGIESTAYLPVTVHIALGVDDNEISPILYAPNPVKNNVTIKSTSILKSVTVYTMLGQKVFKQDYNDTEIDIDLSNLAAGNYVLHAQGETGQKTIRIIKQ